MEIVRRAEIDAQRLPGRAVQKAVGKDGVVRSGKMTVGFARYDPEAGPMAPHQHAEETVYIVDARDGWVRHGLARDQLGVPVTLEAGTVLHFPDLEWHVFEFGPGGFVDAMFIYGQVDNIRPEEMRR
ncbi:MAG: cupin domain-containing protein [Chloroflexota bacterium]